MDRRRMLADPTGREGDPMTTPDRQAGRAAGERRKDAAHALLTVRRDSLIRRARRALLIRLLDVGTATADDVADGIGPSDPDIDPRWLGTVPGPLATAGIIRRIGYDQSSRPIRHASVISVWELADRAAALAWLAHHPEIDEPVAETTASPMPVEPAAATRQTTLW